MMPQVVPCILIVMQSQLALLQSMLQLEWMPIKHTFQMSFLWTCYYDRCQAIDHHISLSTVHDAFYLGHGFKCRVSVWLTVHTLPFVSSTKPHSAIIICIGFVNCHLVLLFKYSSRVLSDIPCNETWFSQTCGQTITSSITNIPTISAQNRQTALNNCKQSAANQPIRLILVYRHSNVGCLNSMSISGKIYRV